MPNSSQDFQWSRFIESELSCLLESSNSNFLAEKPIAVFTCFDEVFDYLESKPELLKRHKDLGFMMLKSYSGKEFIQLYSEIIELDQIDIEAKLKKEEFEISIPSSKNYKKAIAECQRYIYEGDIYQANLSHKFKVLNNKLSEKELKAFIYPRLRKANPSEYMALAEFEDWIVFSSSPESLLKIDFQDQAFNLKSSPIKGTAFLEESSQELKSEKELAEHIMIVDLIRNDLGRIAQTGSVRASKLLQDIEYKNLKHLVSDIEARLKKQYCKTLAGIEIPDFKKIFAALSPGGSITGAPKIRSIEIIEDLENKYLGQKRDLFTGNLGYYKFHEQRGEFNILIRSIFYNKKTRELSFSTGAGITSSSDPEKEYQETLLKAEKLIEVFK